MEESGPSPILSSAAFSSSSPDILPPPPLVLLPTGAKSDPPNHSLPGVDEVAIAIGVDGSGGTRGGSKEDGGGGAGGLRVGPDRHGL